MSDTIIFWSLVSLSAIGFAHSVVFGLCARWHKQNADMIDIDYATYRARKASPPWFIRYSRWVDRKVKRLRRRLGAL
jgi:hypothetical protein